MVHLVFVGLGRRGHRGAGRGAEVLHDDLLDVPVAPVKRSDREQALDPLAPCLPDADEDAGGERDAHSAGGVDHGDALLGPLVGRLVVRHARQAEPRTHALEHQAEARVDLPEARHLGLGEQPRVRVREQALREGDLGAANQ
jgi:hypothetical protein